MTDEGMNLEDAVMGAAEAPPSMRIEFRDPIARYGADGIDRVTPLLNDPMLAAFAVRVIARAADFGAAERARQVLRTALASLQGPTLSDAQAARLPLQDRRWQSVPPGPVWPDTRR